MQNIIQGKLKKHARSVTGDDDIDELTRVLHSLCHLKNGRYNGGLAMCHPQIDQDDPMRFFVTHDGFVVINPKIVDVFDGELVRSNEGCMSYRFRNEKKVLRYKKILVEHGLKTDEDDGVVLEEFDGVMAYIVQHEIDHFNCKDIYNK